MEKFKDKNGNLINERDILVSEEYPDFESRQAKYKVDSNGRLVLELQQIFQGVGNSNLVNYTFDRRDFRDTLWIKKP